MLIGLLLVLLVIMSVRYGLNPSFISDPQPLNAPRYGELADRLDPNTAEAEALASLPNVGVRRAEQIVAHREQFLRESGGGRAFDRAEDLMQVHGIGPAIVETMRPYLVFPMEDGRVGQ